MLRRIRTNSKILIFNQFYQRNLRIGKNWKSGTLDPVLKAVNWTMVVRTVPKNRIFGHVHDFNFPDSRCQVPGPFKEKGIRGLDRSETWPEGFFNSWWKYNNKNGRFEFERSSNRIQGPFCWSKWWRWEFDFEVNLAYVWGKFRVKKLVEGKFCLGRTSSVEVLRPRAGIHAPPGPRTARCELVRNFRPVLVRGSLVESVFSMVVGPEFGIRI